ncbi:hypothetical protein KCP78_17800 [Salmonella enterica subsp. enterica]|nr:hypothetical protein KCP78_17800 [Salmonella enterica subsp. enterica]
MSSTPAFGAGGHLLLDQQNIIAVTVHQCLIQFRSVKFCTADILPVVTGYRRPRPQTNCSTSLCPSVN